MPDHMTLTEFLDWLAATFLIIGVACGALGLAAAIGRFFELYAGRHE